MGKPEIAACRHRVRVISPRTAPKSRNLLSDGATKCDIAEPVVKQKLRKSGNYCCKKFFAAAGITALYACTNKVADAADIKSRGATNNPMQRDVPCLVTGAMAKCNASADPLIAATGSAA